MRLFKRFGVYFVFALLLAYPLYQTVRLNHQSLPLFAFLIPKDSDSAVSTQVWLHAAREQGVPMELLHYEDLLNSFQGSTISSKVILLPDEVARFAPGLLLSMLQNFVEKGGKLVIVGDALTNEFNGRMMESFPIDTYFHFPKVQGRVGDTLQFQQNAVQASSEWLNALQIPPGRYAPSNWSASDSAIRTFCTYQRLGTPYPHWVTEPASGFAGTTLLKGSDGSLIAGINSLGKGQVLWINLPLSFLKKRTDGVFLHAFLRWISEDWAGLPRLLEVPDGIGGMILNVHVDSNAALPGLEVMKNMGMFTQGPFSIHVTAGPDAHNLGDKLGFNLPENKTSQDWVKFWVEHGHEVGAHGGWVHDYFGRNMPDHPTKEFENYLQWNRDAVAKVTEEPVLEYSSPVGNHPVWVTDWIAAHGYTSYYFAGNTGLGPTREFRDEVFTDEKLWSYPVSAFQQVASFEEAADQHVPQKDMEQWLLALSHFASENQTVRLFYFHPPGVKFYQEPLRAWMKANQEIAKQGRFKWYTMNEMSTFLNSREAMDWKVIPSDLPHVFRLLVKSNPGASKMVWRFAKKSVQNLKVITGKGLVRESPTHFEFQPTGTEEIEVQYEETAL